MTNVTKDLPLRQSALSLFTILLLSACAATNHDTRPFIRSAQSQVGPIASEQITYRIILIGDGGYPGPGRDSTLTLLHQRSAEIPERTTVVFLGDNVYERGIPDSTAPQHAEMVERLAAQVRGFASTDASALFIMGNHDWDNSGPRGEEYALRQFLYLQGQAFGAPDHPKVLPPSGCPGPSHLDLPADDPVGFRLVALDTQWWLHDERWRSRSGCFDDGDDYEQASIERLHELQRSAGDRPVIIVGHHPLRSHGPHAGFHSTVPVLGPIANFVRTALRRDQDFSGGANRHMRRQLEQAMEPYDPLVYASGHEHSLQVLEGDESAQWYLVSGTGAKLSIVTDGSDTQFAHSHHGLMVLDLLDEGAVALRVWEPGHDGPVYEQWLTGKNR